MREEQRALRGRRHTADAPVPQGVAADLRPANRGGHMPPTPEVPARLPAPHLARRGYRHQTLPHPGGSARVRIWRAPGAPAGDPSAAPAGDRR